MVAEPGKGEEEAELIVLLPRGAALLQSIQAGHHLVHAQIRTLQQPGLGPNAQQFQELVLQQREPERVACSFFLSPTQ